MIEDFFKTYLKLSERVQWTDGIIQNDSNGLIFGKHRDFTRFKTQSILKSYHIGSSFSPSIPFSDVSSISRNSNNSRLAMIRSSNDITSLEITYINNNNDNEIQRVKINDLGANPLRGLCWNKNDQSIFFIAENKNKKQKKAKKSSLIEKLLENNNDDEEGDDNDNNNNNKIEEEGEKFTFEESWGEQMTKTKTTGIFIYSTVTGKVKEIEIECGNDMKNVEFSYGQCICVDEEDSIIAVRYATTVRRLGLTYCAQRPCDLVLLKKVKGKKDNIYTEEILLLNNSNDDDDDDDDDEKKKTFL